MDLGARISQDLSKALQPLMGETVSRGLGVVQEEGSNDEHDLQWEIPAPASLRVPGGGVQKAPHVEAGHTIGCV